MLLRRSVPHNYITTERRTTSVYLNGTSQIYADEHLQLSTVRRQRNDIPTHVWAYNKINALAHLSITCLESFVVTTGAVSKEINKKIITLYDCYSEEENGVFMD